MWSVTPRCGIYTIQYSRGNGASIKKRLSTFFEYSVWFSYGSVCTISSRPVNPTLANPVYLTGYIEQMGTGTTDIIELCEKSGLHTPEFHQDEDFLIRIWRPENAGASLSTDHQTAHEIDHMSEPIKRLIIAIKGDTKTREEIMNIMQLNHRENFRLTYLIPALETGYIAMLYPDNPKRKGQAYYLTQKGLDVLVSLM